MLLINNRNDNQNKGETRIHYHTGMQEFQAEQGQAGDSSNPKHSYRILMKSFFFSGEKKTLTTERKGSERKP
jgi:hypothetical protein